MLKYYIFVSLTVLFYALYWFQGFNGADLRNVCTEAGICAIRAERDYVLHEDFMKVMCFHLIALISRSLMAEFYLWLKQRNWNWIIILVKEICLWNFFLVFAIFLWSSRLCANWLKQRNWNQVHTIIHILGKIKAKIIKSVCCGTSLYPALPKGHLTQLIHHVHSLISSNH